MVENEPKASTGDLASLIASLIDDHEMEVDGLEGARHVEHAAQEDGSNLVVVLDNGQRFTVRVIAEG